MIDWYNSQTPHAQSRIDDLPQPTSCIGLIIVGLIIGFIIGLMI